MEEKKVEWGEASCQIDRRRFEWFKGEFGKEVSSEEIISLIEVSCLILSKLSQIFMKQW